MWAAISYPKKENKKQWQQTYPPQFLKWHPHLPDGLGTETVVERQNSVFFQFTNITFDAL